MKVYETPMADIVSFVTESIAQTPGYGDGNVDAGALLKPSSNITA